MKNEELRSQLEKLHNELHQSPAIDSQQRELLRTVADEIQALLKRDDIQQHHYTSLSERLSDAVAKLALHEMCLLHEMSTPCTKSGSYPHAPKLKAPVSFF